MLRQKVSAHGNNNFFAADVKQFYNTLNQGENFNEKIYPVIYVYTVCGFAQKGYFCAKPNKRVKK
jgi:hypothetical protein